MASFAVQEFSSGVERVVKEVSLISEMAGIATSGTHNVSATEEQLASIEEISATASSLTHITEELRKLVSTFRL